MAKPSIKEYRVDIQKSLEMVTTVITRLGYSLCQVDNENGIVTFETGMSMDSWGGQKMTVHMLDVADETVQITIGGIGKAHGAQLQVYDWGESGKIAAKVFAELDGLLGEGKVIKGSEDSGSCFVATAVYESNNHPQVIKLRRIRDQSLKRSFLGRAFIRIYYRTGPSLSYFPMHYPRIKTLLKLILDQV